MANRASPPLCGTQTPFRVGLFTARRRLFQVKALQSAAHLSNSEIHAPAFSSAPLVPTAASAVPLRKITDKHKMFEDKSSGLEDTLLFRRRKRIAIHQWVYHLS